jgi:hypothetical protein
MVPESAAVVGCAPTDRSVGASRRWAIAIAPTARPLPKTR